MARAVRWSCRGFFSVVAGRGFLSSNTALPLVGGHPPSDQARLMTTLAASWRPVYGVHPPNAF